MIKKVVIDMSRSVIRFVSLALLATFCLSFFMTGFARADAPRSYTPVEGGQTSFYQVLTVGEGRPSPSISFAYSIEPGAAQAATAGSRVRIISPSAAEGVTGTPTVGTAVFTATDAVLNSLAGTGVEGSVILPADKSAVVKGVTVDFSEVTFSKPGIYRYIVKETSAGQTGVEYDTQKGATATLKERVLDVYVENVPESLGELQVTNYIFHELTSPSVIGVISDGTGETQQLGDKSPGYVNDYAFSAHKLVIREHVEGTRSSVGKYFKYTIEFRNLAAQGVLSIDWSQAAGYANPASDPATVYPVADMITANTRDDDATEEGVQWKADAQGKLTQSFYLKNGQEVTIDNIPDGAFYEIVTIKEDYGLAIDTTESIDVPVIYTPPTPSPNPGGISGQFGTTGKPVMMAGDVIGNYAAIMLTVPGGGLYPNRQTMPLGGSMRDENMTDDGDITFILNRSGTIPTGIFSEESSGILLAAVGLAGLLFLAFGVRKKEESV